MRVNKSYLHDNLLTYYSDDNPFKRMLSDNTGTFSGYKYTANIRRLEKTRKRSLNNRIKIYRLITDSEDSSTIATHDLTLPINAISEWTKITSNEDFKNDVKDQLSSFLEKSSSMTQFSKDLKKTTDSFFGSKIFLMSSNENCVLITLIDY